mmetsp:Transcript_128573/g.222087  ORF Transcript_128573/g.222087 Transcript_128573/m.222087 type:complete len:121 (-) Transcript_128573:186-548(-)
MTCHLQLLLVGNLLVVCSLLLPLLLLLLLLLLVLLLLLLLLLLGRRRRRLLGRWRRRGMLKLTLELLLLSSLRLPGCSNLGNSLSSLRNSSICHTREQPTKSQVSDNLYVPPISGTQFQK